MKLLQGKPLHVRKRAAAIATGSIALVLIVAMIITYAHPRASKHDPERVLVSGYATVLEKIQSLFHRK